MFNLLLIGTFHNKFLLLLEELTDDRLEVLPQTIHLLLSLISYYSFFLIIYLPPFLFRPFFENILEEVPQKSIDQHCHPFIRMNEMLNCVNFDEGIK